MNTQFKLKYNAALAVSILSTAIWLPLAAQAQGLPETTGHVQGTHMQMDSRSHHQAMHGSMNAGGCRHSNINMEYLPESRHGNSGSPDGFAETDPASQFTLGDAGDFQSAEVGVRQTTAGFAETDPASLTPVVDLAISDVSSGRGQLSRAGFAETDPAVSVSRPGVETQNPHHAICSC